MRTQSAVLPILGASTAVSKHVVEAIRSLASRFRLAADRRAAIRSLAAMSDRDLRDIGFDRWEIDELALEGQFPKRHEISRRQAPRTNRNT